MADAGGAVAVAVPLPGGVDDDEDVLLHDAVAADGEGGVAVDGVVAALRDYSVADDVAAPPLPDAADGVGLVGGGAAAAATAAVVVPAAALPRPPAAATACAVTALDDVDEDGLVGRGAATAAWPGCAIA